VGASGAVLRAGLAAVCVVVLSASQLPAASGADSPSRLRERAHELRAQNGSLSAQERAAWLSSVSLGTRIEQTRVALGRWQVRTDAIAAQRAQAEETLRGARRTLAVSQRGLADRLRVLYEQGDTDPMNILVGATSIDEAISKLENLHRIAGQDRHVIDEARTARQRLVGATRRLAAREADARQAAEATAASVAALEASRRERTAMVASLTARQHSNSAEISALESRALAAAVPTRVGGSGQGVTVTATGYSLAGHTATGVAVAYGIVAVDPAVIPLGTRMTIPGYGEGIAADTGGAIVGPRIDLWFPTKAAALAWGTRTVTISLH
jgi:3D (Asp-Asp-Asp) domain-containing protein/peptidoglycan hydrolase CwlO-like protein